MIGSLAGIDGDTLRLATTNSRSLAVPLGSVRRLEVSNGTETHVGSDAGLGFLVGAVLGGLAGAAIYHDEGQFMLGAVVVGFAGGIAGGLVGVAIGSAESERWIEVDPATIRMTRLLDERASIYASIKF
jgi:hypothetical protein